MPPADQPDPDQPVGNRGTALDPVSPAAMGFAERLEPKAATEANGIFLLKCTCGGKHFRHAGYVEVVLPFMRPGAEKRVELMSNPVKVCVACKKAWVWLNEQLYDVSDQIDLGAWMRTEQQAHQATGPGGQC